MYRSSIVDRFDLRWRKNVNAAVVDYGGVGITEHHGINDTPQQNGAKAANKIRQASLLR